MNNLDIKSIASRLGGEVRDNQALVPGPNHSKNDRSLSIKLAPDTPDGFVVNSFANDDPIACKDHVRRELGIGEFKPAASISQKTVYEYRNPITGEVVYRKTRIDKADSKSFFFEPKGRGGSAPLLYGADRLKEAKPGAVVMIVEGEKKVDTLRKRGLLAVSADSGANSKWSEIDVSSLAPFQILIWPDSDDAGEKYAASAAERLRAANQNSDVRVIRPFPPAGKGKGKDVCDYAGSDADLAALINGAAPYGDAPVQGKFQLEPFDSIKYSVSEGWAITHVLPRKGVAALFGASGSFKSFVAFDMAMAVATGMPWAGRKTHQGPVVYIAAEGAEGLRKRKAGFAKHWSAIHGSKPTGVPFFMIPSAPNFGVEDGDRDELVETIASSGVSPALVIIDTLSQTLFSADENGAGMTQFVGHMNAISQRFGCLVLVIHHVGHGNDSRLRGHSSLQGAMDAIIRVDRIEGGELASMLTMTKLKDEASNTAFEARLERVVLGADSDGSEVSTLVVRDVFETDSKPAKKKEGGPNLGKNQKLLYDAIVTATAEHGASLADGVMGVDDEVVRDLYYAAIAEKAAPDELPSRLQERQRKGFNTAIQGMLQAELIFAYKENNVRFLILPDGSGKSGRFLKNLLPRPPVFSTSEAGISGNSSRNLPQPPAPVSSFAESGNSEPETGISGNSSRNLPQPPADEKESHVSSFVGDGETVAGDVGYCSGSIEL